MKDIKFNKLMKNTENTYKERNESDSFMDSIHKYKKSFKKEKFKNNSKSTAESFEKFSLYKDKFFEIFK